MCVKKDRDVEPTGVFANAARSTMKVLQREQREQGEQGASGAAAALRCCCWRKGKRCVICNIAVFGSAMGVRYSMLWEGCLLLVRVGGDVHLL